MLTLTFVTVGTVADAAADHNLPWRARLADAPGEQAEAHRAESQQRLAALEREVAALKDQQQGLALLTAQVQRLTDAILTLFGLLQQLLEQPPVVGSLPPAALSLKDTARFIGLEVASIEHLIKTRKLAYSQVGAQRGRVVQVVDALAFLREHRQATGEELKKKRGRGRRPG
jgi:hypothetical protein